jgi:hypothetical protein
MTPKVVFIKEKSDEVDTSKLKIFPLQNILLIV